MRPKQGGRADKAKNEEKGAVPATPEPPRKREIGSQNLEAVVVPRSTSNAVNLR